MSCSRTQVPHLQIFPKGFKETVIQHQSDVLFIMTKFIIKHLRQTSNISDRHQTFQTDIKHFRQTSNISDRHQTFQTDIKHLRQTSNISDRHQTSQTDIKHLRQTSNISDRHQTCVLKPLFTLSPRVFLFPFFLPITAKYALATTSPCLLEAVHRYHPTSSGPTL